MLAELHDRATSDPDKVPKPIQKRLVILVEPEFADPEIDARNAARGWEPRVVHVEEDGTRRVLAYHVIETAEDARKAARSPRVDTA